MTKSIIDGKDFKLGLFSSNCSGGMAVSKAPDGWIGATPFPYLVPFQIRHICERLHHLRYPNWHLPSHQIRPSRLHPRLKLRSQLSPLWPRLNAGPDPTAGLFTT